MQVHDEIEIDTRGQGLYPVTDPVLAFVANSGIADGLLTIFCRHTSASLTIQENADPDVVRDIAEFYARIAPEGMQWLRHVAEGPDDMPAHLRTMLSDTSCNIPVRDRRPLLGTWQGIFLFEHRHRAHRRKIALHLMGN